jgi:hypothetical protein
MNETRVVNINTLPEPFPPDHIYIGREGHRFDGYFGNPSRIEPGVTRGVVLTEYALYFSNRIVTDLEFARRILQLRGKVLVCFCAPQICHGDVIAGWLNAPKSCFRCWERPATQAYSTGPLRAPLYGDDVKLVCDSCAPQRPR